MKHGEFVMLVPDQAEWSTSLLSVQDTTRPIVKNHHSVVLRAESAAEKFSWLNRLLAASGNPQAPRAAPNKPQPGKPTSPEQPKVPTPAAMSLFSYDGDSLMLQQASCRPRPQFACVCFDAYKPFFFLLLSLVVESGQ